jgi:hypothetical protein
MSKERIQITIPLQGPISAEALGYQGKACALDLKLVQDALGGEAEIKNKAEYYKPAKEQERERST